MILEAIHAGPGLGPRLITGTSDGIVLNQEGSSNRPYSAKMKFQVSVAMTTTTPRTIGQHADRLHPRFEVHRMSSVQVMTTTTPCTIGQHVDRLHPRFEVHRMYSVPKLIFEAHTK